MSVLTKPCNLPRVGQDKYITWMTDCPFSSIVNHGEITMTKFTFGLFSATVLAASFSLYPIPQSQANDAPTCANGNATDPDGDGWGYENGVSCLVKSMSSNACSMISHSDLTRALSNALTTSNGGLDFAMWATLVDRSGTVCSVTKADGLAGDDPWPGSRVISAQKANTANAFSNRQLALSTANLFAPVQDNASLFGLQESNPVDTTVAYAGNASSFGSANDPMKGGRIGGVNVFGGGVALYYNGEVIGAIGVSGDTSCADHNIAWKTRENLRNGDFTPSNSNVGGVGPAGTDDINFDKKGGNDNGIIDGFEHAANCPGTPLDYVPNTAN